MVNIYVSFKNRKSTEKHFNNFKRSIMKQVHEFQEDNFRNKKRYAMTLNLPQNFLFKVEQ